MKSWGIRSVARALAQPVTYLGIAMLVFLYSALAYLLAADRRSAEVEAMSRGDNLVRVLDQSYHVSFRAWMRRCCFSGSPIRKIPQLLIFPHGSDRPRSRTN